MIGASLTTLPPEDLLGRAAQKKKEQDASTATAKAAPAPVPTPAEATKSATAGQFEDADDDAAMAGATVVEAQEPALSSSQPTSAKPSSSCALDFLADACNQSDEQADAKHDASSSKSIPPPAGLRRRISTNTSNATSALLEMSSGRPSRSATSNTTGNTGKTFAMHLELISRYKKRYGYLDVRKPIINEQWEQDMWAWLARCRSSFRAGFLSHDKARALTELGLEGFGTSPTGSSRTVMNRNMHTMEGATAAAAMMHQQQGAGGGFGPNAASMMMRGMPRHAALQAMFLRRQEEARMVQMRAGGLRPAALIRRCSQDPDGELPKDADVYPGGEGLVLSGEVSSNKNTMMAAAQREAPRGSALEEIMRREAMARGEAQALAREQQMAAAMASRRMPMGPGFAQGAGMGGRQTSLMSSPLHAPRVMSLLQPLESGNTRPSDPSFAHHHPGNPYADPRISAMLAAQMAQRRAADFRVRRASEANCFRRASDAMQDRRASDASTLYSNDDGDQDDDHLVLSQDHANANDLHGSKRAKPREHKARKSWEERMKQMRLFFLTHGHTQVLTRGENKELGRWLSSIRCKIRDGILPHHQVEVFLSMEDWSAEAGGVMGRQRRAMAAVVAAAHMEEPPEDNSSLSTNNSSRRNSASTAITDDGVPVAFAMPTNKLDINKTANAPSSPTSKSSSNVRRALPKSWNHSFGELRAFRQLFGHCDVKMIVNSPYGLLGKWLASQRSRHKLEQLPTEKVKRLRDLGCVGFGDVGNGAAGFQKEPDSYESSDRKDPEEAEFDFAIRRLQATSDTASATEEDMIYSNGSTPDNSAPPSPSGAKSDKRVRHSYESRLDHVKEYKAKHGHCKIRLGSTDRHEELLARWLASARSRHRSGQFKDERAAELSELGCDGFEPLRGAPATASVTGQKVETKPKAPKKRKPDAPARTATPSPTLGLEQENGGEPAAKKQCIANAKEGTKRQTFADMLQELESYQYVFGVGCSVPKPDGDGGKLGRWLAFQRRQFLAGKLAAERIEKLRAIGRKEFCASDLVVRAAERAAASILDHY